MPTVRSTKAQSPSHLVLTPLLLILFAFLTCPSHTHALPYATTRLARRDVSARTETAGDFSRDFVTAIAVASTAVLVLTTVICVFAHCWRQILRCSPRGRDGDGAVVKNRARDHEEDWFCGQDRGLPLPQVESPEPASEPMRVLRPSSYNLVDKYEEVSLNTRRV
ncbi:hypothetical protein F5Y19DRAFT_473992 [Xylariaceae sp. FL1651]|nr:hypothetical protein F5Y19DRAFT_473992 [Xylariaceae sp. FL1651]